MADRQARAHRAPEIDPRDTETPARSRDARPKAKPLYDHALTSGPAAKAQPVATVRANDPSAALASKAKDPAALHVELRRLAYEAAPDPGASMRLQQAAKTLAETNGLDATELITATADAIAEARRAPDFPDRFVQAHMATGREDVGRAASALTIVAEHGDRAAIRRAILARAKEQGRERHALLRLGAQAGAPESDRAAGSRGTAAEDTSGKHDKPGGRAPGRPADADLASLRAAVAQGLPPQPTEEDTARHRALLEELRGALRREAKNLELTTRVRAESYAVSQQDRLSRSERIVKPVVDCLDAVSPGTSGVAAQMALAHSRAEVLAMMSGALPLQAEVLIAFHDGLTRAKAHDELASTAMMQVGDSQARAAKTAADGATLVSELLFEGVKGAASKTPLGHFVAIGLDFIKGSAAKLADQNMNHHGAKVGDVLGAGFESATVGVAQSILKGRILSATSGKLGALKATAAASSGAARTAGRVGAEVSTDALAGHAAGIVVQSVHETIKETNQSGERPRNLFSTIASKAMEKAANPETLGVSVLKSAAHAGGAAAK